MLVAIAGNIGAGKTTLTAKLAEQLAWKIQYEPVENNPYLNDFYEDMKRWSFNLQIYFLNNRFKNAMEVKDDEIPVIQDRTMYEDAYIFANNLHDMGLMNSRDYENYLSIFESLMAFVKPPDLMIYLKASTPVLVRQIQKRGREYEKGIDIEYLERLNTHYENWISTYKEGKLLVINVEDYNFAESEEDLQAVIQLINEKIPLQLNIASK